MYKLIDSRAIWGAKPSIAAGYPEDTAPDLCFINDNFPSRPTPINSKVLIEALKNSPDILHSFGFELVPVVREPNGDTQTIAIASQADESNTGSVEDSSSGVTPPLTDDTAQDDAEAKESTDSLAQDSPVVQKREYTQEEKTILTAARKSYEREMGCSYAEAKAHVAEHAEEYIAAHYAALTKDGE